VAEPSKVTAVATIDNSTVVSAPGIVLPPAAAVGTTTVELTAVPAPAASLGKCTAGAIASARTRSSWAHVVP
jgi:hypothetical protein